MLRKNAGFTMVELLVTVVVGAIAVSIVLTLLKNIYGLSGQLKSKLDSQTYVNAFTKNFQEDVESAGYVDFSKKIYGDSQVVSSADCPVSICVSDGDIRLQSNLIDSGQYRVTEQIQYLIKKIEPARSAVHPNELGIYKFRRVNGLSIYNESDANGLVLAGVKSFTCKPYNPGTLKVVECSLTVYRSMMKEEVDTFNIYATNEN